MLQSNSTVSFIDYYNTCINIDYLWKTIMRVDGSLGDQDRNLALVNNIAEMNKISSV